MTRKTILYVEDEESDVFLMRKAFEKSQRNIALESVDNGETALDYLRGNGRFSNRDEHPFPGLILLDLNIPRVHGFKVLEWIRNQPALASLPIVVYTSSEEPRDLEAARRLGANDYIVKPSGLEKISTTAKNIIQRWLQ